METRSRDLPGAGQNRVAVGVMAAAKLAADLKKPTPGGSLSPLLADRIAPSILSLTGFTQADQVLTMDEEMLGACLEDAWPKVNEEAKFMPTHLAIWLAKNQQIARENQSEAIKQALLAEMSVLPGTKAASAPAPKKKATFKSKDSDAEDTDDPDDVSIAGELTSVDSASSKKAVKDAARLGMSADRITALDMSIHCLEHVSVEEVEGIAYGTDSSALAKALRFKKLGKETLPTLLESGDMHRVNDALNELTRDLNGQGLTPEVTCVSTFLTTTIAFFEGDSKGFCAYVKACRRKWKGRAFPYEFDTQLVLKSIKRGGDGLAKVKELKEELAKQVKELKDELASVKGELRNVKRLAEEAKRTGGSPSDASKVTCSYCKEKGHWRSACPKRAADLAEKAEEDKKEE